MLQLHPTHKPKTLSQFISAFDCAAQEPEPKRLSDELSQSESFSEPALKFSLMCVHDAVDILKKMNLDSRSILCAVLSTVPFADIKSKLIETNYLSPESANILKHLELFNLDFRTNSGDTPLSEVVIQLINLGSIDPRMLFIKIAFEVARLREAVRTNSDNLMLLAEEALKIYAPIAHRFGFHQLKSEFENTSFKILHPQEYQEIGRYTNEKVYYHGQMIDKITAILKQNLEENSIKGEISGRMKEFYSIYKKSIKKNITLSNLYDIIAFRVIVEKKEDCYQVLSLIQETFKPLDRFKDYIVNPKPNGYQSLHTTVEYQDGSVFEVQIRDRQMHLHAEMGVSAHWLYKENKVHAEQTEGSEWIRRLNDTLKKADNPQYVFNLFEGELSTEFIYTFTPNGQVIKLPRNATVIDFAFAVHSQIGIKCTGARVNDKFVTIRTVLNNGDLIEIVTAKNITPSVDWLDFAITKKARQHIRYSLTKEKSNQLREQGLKQFLKVVKKLGLKFNRPEEHPIMKLLLKKRKKNSPVELYQGIAEDGLSEKEVEDLIKQVTSVDSNRQEYTKPQVVPVSNEAILKIKDQMFIPIRFAKCCRPEYPSPISGIADGRDMVIHQSGCAVINRNAEDEFKKIPLLWDTPKPKTIMNIEIIYSSGLKTTAKIFGLLAKFDDEFISETITKQKDEFKQTVVLKVKDDKKYQAFYQKLSKIKGVSVSVT